MPEPPLVDTLRRAYVEAVRRGDAAAVAALFAEDGALRAPGMPPAEGRAEVERAFRSLFALGDVRLELAVAHVDGSRDAIVESGAYATTITPRDGEPVRDRGRDVRVWRRGADGAWRLHSTIWRPDGPPEAARPRHRIWP